MKKHYFPRIFIGALFCSLFLFSQPHTYAVTEAAITSDNQSTIRSSNIIWRYKYLNGKLYKRKYDTTSGEWIGNWIPV